MKGILRAAVAALMWSSVQAGEVGPGPAEAGDDHLDGGSEAWEVGSAVPEWRDWEHGGAAAGLEGDASSGAPAPEPTMAGKSSEPALLLAQFQVAPPTAPGAQPSPEAPDDSGGAVPRFRRGEGLGLPQNLKYQYSLGTESDITYRTHPGLDTRVNDNSLVLGPQLTGYILYRPTLWFETMLEMILDKGIVLERGNGNVPGGLGEPRGAQPGVTSLSVEQAFVTFKRLGPASLTFGRRNFEDDRHWLYDTALDVAYARVRQGAFQAEFSVGRKDWVSLDLITPVKETRINNYIAYFDYRGPLDIRYAAYVIYRDDRTGAEGKPVHLGLRSYGMPTDEFNFWSDVAILRGTDEMNRQFRGHAFDVGATYRFPKLPWHPSISLAFAYGSGESDASGSKNREFRQTGLESNEWRLSGIAKFKYYGEVLDPELSNLRIFTAGVGFRPAPHVYVDLVYHKYWLNSFTDQLRNSAVTALMNQTEMPPSKDVGQALDIIVGLRNLFGIRRLGLDLRAGLFFPGRAFVKNVGTETAPVNRNPDKSIFFLAKFWY